MARKLVWEVPLRCWPLSLEPAQATIHLTGDGSSPFNSGTQTLVSHEELDFETHDESIWVERIVGQTVLYGANAAEGTFNRRLAMERVHVGTAFHVDTNLVDMYQYDLFNRDGAEERFLWNRVRSIQQANNTSSAPATPYGGVNEFAQLDPSAHPWWTSVDIRVGRHLRAPDILGLTLQVPLDLGDHAYYFAWLRMLVAR